MRPTQYLRLNPYDVLGVRQDASTKQIKSKFFKLSKTYHPDRTRTMPKAKQDEHTKKFQQIREAYETLMDPSKRASVASTESPPERDPHGSFRNARTRGSHMHRKPRPTEQYATGRARYRRQQAPHLHPLHPKTTRGDYYDVPHFDFDRHFKQQQGYDAHREAKRKVEESQHEHADRERRGFPVMATTAFGLSALLLYSLYR